ncbi:MAG: prepilin-type N-terminal cleavage/methylation domain-containing protein [Elusimicrobiaceae bacterium]|nr:prepilin-type N-terminal cleavage/methylation domain-containing protein [Elusimicrobiaceae bacterium]
MKKGFTLIELLVVVIIIGILAAIALSQYEKAVEKSKTGQAVVMLKSLYQAAIEYQMANGTWPSFFSDLSVSPPWTGKTNWYESSLTKDVLSNKDWSLQLTTNPPSHTGINIGRLNGTYKGGGFAIWFQHDNNHIPRETLLCAEKKADITVAGDFCQMLMQSGDLIYDGSVLRLYDF